MYYFRIIIFCMALQLEKQLLMDMTIQGIQALSTFDTPEAFENKNQLSSIYEELVHQDADEIDFFKSLGIIKKLCAISPEMLKTRFTEKYQEHLKELGKQKPLDTSFEIPNFD